MKQKSKEHKTAKQWLREGKIPNDVKGEKMWCTRANRSSAVYYLPTEVRNATEEEILAIKQQEKEERAKRREERKEQIEDLKNKVCYYKYQVDFFRGQVEDLEEQIKQYRWLLKQPSEPNKTLVIDLRENADGIKELAVINGLGEVLIWEQDDPSKEYEHLKSLVENAEYILGFYLVALYNTLSERWDISILDKQWFDLCDRQPRHSTINGYAQMYGVAYTPQDLLSDTRAILDCIKASIMEIDN